jgi:hypothetical protein
MPLVWMVIGLSVWMLVTVVVVALCASARRTDEALGERRARSCDPVEPRRPAPAEVEME